MNELVTEMENGGDFVSLGSKSEYARYFNKVGRAFSLLLSWYTLLAKEKTEKQEIHTVKMFLDKLHYTIKVLAARQAFNLIKDLKLDLNDSGYPHSIGFISLETDLRASVDRLMQFPPAEHLKSLALDYIFKHGGGEELTDILWKLSEREYLESLDEEKLFFIFTPGELVLQSEDEEYRRYTYSWACFDFRSNMPFVHVMAFDQDSKAEPLHTPASLSRVQFLEAVKTYGSRASSCLLLATSIDDALPNIHPKILKRTRLGPILMPEFSKESHDLLDLMREHGCSDDVIFLIKSEIIFSGKQVKRKKFLAPTQVREVFVVPTDDSECLREQASRIYRHMLAPHRVVQHLEVLKSDESKKLKDYDIVTYNPKGELHGI